MSCPLAISIAVVFISITTQQTINNREHAGPMATMPGEENDSCWTFIGELNFFAPGKLMYSD